MSERTSDLRIRTAKPLVAPARLEADLPLPDDAAARVARTRREIALILAGKDDRLLVICGPCSIHDPVAAREYAGLLKTAAARHEGELLLVMRVYFEKPRTVVGWKGLINDPRRDGSYEINEGLRLARQLMIDINVAGVPVGTEFLDTTLGQYYADLVSWGAIGARTVESQVHRELASGLSMPVGFKNRRDGDLQVAVDAVLSAREPHWFPSLTREGTPAVMGTAGNEQAHVILRGGQHGPNFDAASVARAADLLAARRLPARVMVDCSHANSGKDAGRQVEVARDLAGQIAAGGSAIAGVMLESNLVEGSQDYRAEPLVYGRSITDACISWGATAGILERLAEAVAKRRGSSASSSPP